MQTLKLDIKTEDGSCDCFAAYPDDGKKYSAVLFLMDGFGPREYLYEMAQTIAALGYYVLLPNLFYRVRRAPLLDGKFPVTEDTLGDMRKQLMALFAVYKREENEKDIGVFLDMLAKNPQVKPGKVGVTGYCMGGGLAIRAAEIYPDRIGAAASFHAGRLANADPASPHLFVNRIKAPVYFGHADQDPSMPKEDIDRLEHALKAAHVEFESEIYSGASHGFTMADLPAYNEAALKRHWVKLTELLKAEL